VLVVLFVDWTLDHLDLVQDRPFAHRFPPVPDRASARGIEQRTGD
jgi:hypothetical protein